MANAKMVQSSEEIFEISRDDIHKRKESTILFYFVTQSKMFTDVQKLSIFFSV